MLICSGNIYHTTLSLLIRSWSYGVNLTLIGNAVFVSMDIPDVFFAVRLSSNTSNLVRTLATNSTFSDIKIMQLPQSWDDKNIYVYSILWNLDVRQLLYLCWTVFWGSFSEGTSDIGWIWSSYTPCGRNLISFRTFYFRLPSSSPTQKMYCSESSRFFHPSDGVWMVWWMKHQIFFAILALQLINLFWYFLIIRVAVRSVTLVSFLCWACIKLMKYLQGANAREYYWWTVRWRGRRG